MRYFINDAGGWLSANGDVDLLGIVPDGYHEVDEAEFNAEAGTVTVTPPPVPPGK